MNAISSGIVSASTPAATASTGATHSRIAAGTAAPSTSWGR